MGDGRGEAGVKSERKGDSEGWRTVQRGGTGFLEGGPWFCFQHCMGVP